MRFAGVLLMAGCGGDGERADLIFTRQRREVVKVVVTEQGRGTGRGGVINDDVSRQAPFLVLKHMCPRLRENLSSL